MVKAAQQSKKSMLYPCRPWFRARDKFIIPEDVFTGGRFASNNYWQRKETETKYLELIDSA